MRLPKGSEEIYDKILSIKAQKSKMPKKRNSLWPGELFEHKFTSKAKIYGLPNGDILIKSTDGKRLWKPFEYDESEGSRRR
jgi:hypothetical protein